VGAHLLVLEHKGSWNRQPIVPTTTPAVWSDMAEPGPPYVRPPPRNSRAADAAIPTAHEEAARLRKLVALWAATCPRWPARTRPCAVAQVLSNGIGAAVAILDRELQPLAPPACPSRAE